MIRRDVSTSTLTNFAANSNDVNNRIIQKAKKATISEKIITIAAVRDQTSDKLRAMIYSLKNFSTQQTLM